MSSMKMRDFVNYLNSQGASFHRQCGNSHARYISSEGVSTVPTNHKVISPGVIRQVCRELKIEQPE